jgi:hypothetical protein
MASGRERRAIGESIAQRSLRSQRGIEGGRHGFWAGKTRNREEHRTEVTEVTEGGLRLCGGRFFGGRLGFRAGKTRSALRGRDVLTMLSFEFEEERRFAPAKGC